MTSAREEKWRAFYCFFSIQGTAGSPKGPGPENRVGEQEMEKQGRLISSGLQVPGDLGTCAIT